MKQKFHYYEFKFHAHTDECSNSDHQIDTKMKSSNIFGLFINKIWCEYATIDKVDEILASVNYIRSKSNQIKTVNNHN